MVIRSAVVVRGVVVGVAFCVLVVGCRSQSSRAPELSLEPGEPVLTEQDDGCAGLINDVDITSVEGRLNVVLDTVDAVQAGQCDPVAPDARVCRSLFLIAATDPLVAIALELPGPMVVELADRHRWALEEGVAAAGATGNTPLVAALAEMAELGVADAIQAGPDRVATVAVQRAARSIIEPLSEAEEACRNN